MRWNSASPP